jgi:hypothetical protein
MYKLEGPYSHLSNKPGGWNKHRGCAKNTKTPNVEEGISM